MFGLSVKKIAAVLGILALMGAAGLWGVWNYRFEIFEMRFAPRHDFAAADIPAAPDYAKRESWSAWPDDQSYGAMVPAGFEPLAADARKADVFYVHATTFDKPHAWNADLADADLNRVTDRYFAARHASIFNGCCRIFAPRYRQGTLFASRRNNANTIAAMGVAYEDIRAAFRHYMAHENNGRPFILASHSQGTSHVERLLYDEISGKPAALQMVAAYLVGYWLPAELPEATGIQPCTAPDQTGCIAAWDSYTDKRKPFEKMDVVGHWNGSEYRTDWSGKKLCVNPISWRSDEQMSGVGKGALPVDYARALNIDPAQSMQLPQLRADLVTAQCRNGRLYVPLFTDGVFRYKPTMPSYHRFDFEFFYADIWHNAVMRVNAFVKDAP